jgi:hypothetical protein
VNLPVVVEFLEQKNRDAVRHGAITAQRRHTMIVESGAKRLTTATRRCPAEGQLLTMID